AGDEVLIANPINCETRVPGDEISGAGCGTPNGSIRPGLNSASIRQGGSTVLIDADVVALEQVTAADINAETTGLSSAVSAIGQSGVVPGDDVPVCGRGATNRAAWPIHHGPLVIRRGRQAGYIGADKVADHEVVAGTTYPKPGTVGEVVDRQAAYGAVAAR